MGTDSKLLQRRQITAATFVNRNWFVAAPSLMLCLFVTLLFGFNPNTSFAQGLKSPNEAPPQSRLEMIPQPAPVIQNPMEASPLVQYSTTGGVMNQITKLHGSQLLNHGEVLFTKKVDFGPALQKYATLKNCSLNDAFAKATEFLRLAPRDAPKQNDASASAFYQIVDKDVLQVTAPKKFFEQLPGNLTCIENGIRHIEMQILFVTIPAGHKTDIRRWIIPGTHEAFNNKIPQANAFATQATYKNEAASRAATQPGVADDQARGTMVSASETVTKAFPTFIARLDQKGVESFRKYVLGNEERNTTLSPTIRVVPGQPATITDGSARPFVVGVNRVEGEFTVAHQPIVQPIEEGTLVKVRAMGESGKIRLDSDIAHSTIESVESYTYDDMQGKNNAKDAVTVQVPEHRLKQVHISTLVEEGKTVLIEAFGPTKVSYRLPKRGLAKQGKLATRVARSMILLTPKWVDVDQGKTVRLKVKKR